MYRRERTRRARTASISDEGLPHQELMRGINTLSISCYLQLRIVYFQHREISRLLHIHNLDILHVANELQCVGNILCRHISGFAIRLLLDSQTARRPLNARPGVFYSIRPPTCPTCRSISSKLPTHARASTHYRRILRLLLVCSSSLTAFTASRLPRSSPMPCSPTTTSHLSSATPKPTNAPSSPSRRRHPRRRHRSSSPRSRRARAAAAGDARCSTCPRGKSPRGPRPGDRNAIRPSRLFSAARCTSS